jgi:hypothetical protein
MGLLFGQTPYHGSWSTLFAATDPSLAGDQFAYIGPNQLGLVRAASIPIRPNTVCMICSLLWVALANCPYSNSQLHK